MSSPQSMRLVPFQEPKMHLAERGHILPSSMYNKTSAMPEKVGIRVTFEDLYSAGNFKSLPFLRSIDSFSYNRRINPYGSP